MMNDTADINIEQQQPEKEDISKVTIQAYDFESQERIVRGRMPTLELINERFARSMRVTLFNFFRHTISISVKKNRVEKFGDYAKTLKVPTSINMIKMYPVAGTILMILNSDLVFALVESFFGGDGRFEKKSESRDFTPTETRIIKRILDLTFADLKDAWKGLMSVDFEYQATEVNPSMATIVAPTDIVVISEFTIGLEGGSGDFHIVVPYSILEPLKEILDSKIHSEHGKNTDNRWEKALQTEILDVNVEITSKLAEIRMPMKSILKLQEGDIIPFEMPEQLTVCIQGVPTFHATYGESNNHAALKIVEAIPRPVDYK